MSDSSQLHGLQPTRLLRPWDFLGKSTRVGCHCFLWQRRGVWFKTQGLKKINWGEGLPWWLSGKESACQCRKHGFDPWSGKIPWRREWQPTPINLPGESYGRRSLVGYSPWGHKESDMTERLHFHFSLSCIGERNGNPLQYSCLENPRDGRAWWAAVYGVAQSRT